MPYDLNGAGPQQDYSDPIPAGTMAKVVMTMRPGGLGEEGILKQSETSDAEMLDCEFTVDSAPLHSRRFWQHLTISGGKKNDQGESKGWVITRSFLRAAFESAKGIDPKDESEPALAARRFTYLAELHGLTFAVKIGIEKAKPGSGHRDKNKITCVITPDKPEWQRIMQGETILPAAPSFRPAASENAWGAPGPVALAAPATPVQPAMPWGANRPAVAVWTPPQSTQQPVQQPVQPVQPVQPAGKPTSAMAPVWARQG